MNEIYLQALLGGALIGVASILLMLTLGKIVGISGIVFESLRPNATDKGWRWSFIIGLICAPLITQMFGFSLPTNIDTPLLTLAIGGLLVGVGTKMGSGCTSGHGICGIGRLSKRSIVATLTFMFTAFSTVTVLNHLV